MSESTTLSDASRWVEDVQKVQYFQDVFHKIDALRLARRTWRGSLKDHVFEGSEWFRMFRLFLVKWISSLT